jgi:hypothetical protein
MDYTKQHLCLQGNITQIISENLVSRIHKVFNSLGIKSILWRANIRKQTGFIPDYLLFILVIFPLLKQTMLQSIQKIAKSKKDTFYRFANHNRYNWRSLIYGLVLKIIPKVKEVPLTERVLIADDTIETKKGRKIELISYIFDHVLGKSVLGFCDLLLTYFDGRSLLPLDFAKVSSKKPLEGMRKIDKRTNGYKRRKEALEKKTDLLIELIQRAKRKGIDAYYVLFDSWFAHDRVIHEIYEIGYHVICRFKRNAVRFKYHGKSYTSKQLYSLFVRKQMAICPELGLEMGYLDVELPLSGKVRLVFSRLVHNKKWILFLSTDTDISPLQIIKTYSKRWAIEVFFKDCKQNLCLGKEQNRNFDALIASTSLVFIRYILLSYLLRRQEDFMTIGSLFRNISEEIMKQTLAVKLWEFFKQLITLSIPLFLPRDVITGFGELFEFIDDLLDISSFYGARKRCET